VKTTLFLIIASVLVCVPAYGQAATKIEEISNVQCEYHLLIMDLAIIEAGTNPDSVVFVLVYEGMEIRYRKQGPEMVRPRRGSADAQITSMKQYLSSRGLKEDLFSFVKAGFREKSTVEFWLAPKGAPPPQPTPTLSKIKYRSGRPVGFCTWCCG
jgi:hypothetical protein